MPSHRTERVAEAIRETVASTILFNLADPRVKGVTVLRAEVSGDLRRATVFVSVMGTDPEKNLAMYGLRHACGFIQARVAARLQTRHTPVLSFKLDETAAKSVEISRLIDLAVAADRKGKPDAEEEEKEVEAKETLSAETDDLEEEEDDDDLEEEEALEDDNDRKKDDSP